MLVVSIMTNSMLQVLNILIHPYISNLALTPLGFTDKYLVRPYSPEYYKPVNSFRISDGTRVLFTI